MWKTRPLNLKCPEHITPLTIEVQERPPGFVEYWAPDVMPGLITKHRYHFTSLWHFEAILTEGYISRGDVPLTPSGGYNALWLTKDPDWDRQGWAGGSEICKTEVRLTIMLPDEALPYLKHWPELANAENVEERWYRALAQGGGNPEDWYVFMGRIPLRWVLEGKIRDPATGCLSVITFDVRRSQEEK